MAVLMNDVNVALGLIYREKQVLFAERPLHKSYSGYWELPGGKIEPNETAHDALVRELNEEIGIVISQASPFHHYRYTYPERAVDLQVFSVTSYQGEPYGREGQRLRWVAITDFNTLNLLPGMLPLLPSMIDAIKTDSLF